MQEYDGATISSGCRAGVHAKNPEKQIKALYRHYAGHSSLFINSCTVPPIRNCIDHIKSIT